MMMPFNRSAGLGSIGSTSSVADVGDGFRPSTAPNSVVVTPAAPRADSPLGSAKKPTSSANRIHALKQRVTCETESMHSILGGLITPMSTTKQSAEATALQRDCRLMKWHLERLEKLCSALANEADAVQSTVDQMSSGRSQQQATSHTPFHSEFFSSAGGFETVNIAPSESSRPSTQQTRTRFTPSSAMGVSEASPSREENRPATSPSEQRTSKRLTPLKSALVSPFHTREYPAPKSLQTVLPFSEAAEDMRSVPTLQQTLMSTQGSVRTPQRSDSLCRQESVSRQESVNSKRSVRQGGREPTPTAPCDGIEPGDWIARLVRTLREGDGGSVFSMIEVDDAAGCEILSDGAACAMEQFATVLTMQFPAIVYIKDFPRPPPPRPGSGRASFVTQCEAGIVATLDEKFPDHPFHSSASDVDASPSLVPVRRDRQLPFCVVAADAAGTAYVTLDVSPWVLMPTGYAMASHHPMRVGSAPRNWAVEVSLDGELWTVLQEHSDDHSIGKHANYGVWELRNPERAVCSHIRIRSTGPCALGTRNLQVSSLEVYGRALYCEPGSLPSAPAELFHMGPTPPIKRPIGMAHAGPMPPEPVVGKGKKKPKKK